MQITPQILRNLLTGFRTDYNGAFEGVKSYYKDVAMVTKSSTAKEAYGWLGQMPILREWVGERRLKTVQSFGFEIDNRDFESTINIKRNDIEDDIIGVFKPMFQELGRVAAEQPDKLIFDLLAKGFTGLCYDGQPFFSTQHPVSDTSFKPGVASNFQDGPGPAWYLLDTTRAIRPLIYQERRPFVLNGMTQPDDPHVFMTNQFVYGVDGRAAAGFGMWQLAFGSKAPLNASNFEAAKIAMKGIKGDQGRSLGVNPNLLVAPDALETDALTLLKKQNLAGGESNIYYNAADLIVVPWLDA